MRVVPGSLISHNDILCAMTDAGCQVAMENKKNNAKSNQKYFIQYNIIQYRSVEY